MFIFSHLITFLNFHESILQSIQSRFQHLIFLFIISFFICSSYIGNITISISTPILIILIALCFQLRQYFIIVNIAEGFILFFDSLILEIFPRSIPSTITPIIFLHIHGTILTTILFLCIIH